MKKIILAIGAVVVLAGLCSFALFKHHQATEAAKQTPNQWKVEGISEYKVMDIALDNDSAFTGALEALVTAKIEYGKVPVSVRVKVSDTKTPMDSVKNIILCIQNGDCTLTDTLERDSSNAHYAEGVLSFDAARLHKDSLSTESIIGLLKALGNGEAKITVKD